MSPKIYGISTLFFFLSKPTQAASRASYKTYAHRDRHFHIPKLRGTAAGEQLRFVARLYSKHAFATFSSPEPYFSQQQ
uniref:Putative secreted protein n=1 Tax=Amblyomma parvum TaxID=251391 RepID=A0A023FZX6_AMBPA